MEREALTKATTDLTLFFGAESFISQSSGATVFDPDGEECLAVLIDLIVNCESLRVALPQAVNHNPSQLVPLLKEYFSELPDAMLPLRPEIEVRIVQEFVAYARARGWSWFSTWTMFQLTSPIVTNGHALRLGGRIVSPEAQSLWISVGPEISSQLNWRPLLGGVKLPGFVHEHMGKVPAEEFPLCYAFDVYRRGWQYAECVRLRDEDSAYVPHSLRVNCLDRTAAWLPVEFRQKYLWSWGKYICAVLKDPQLPAYRTPKAVVEMVNRIKRVMAEPGGCPTWDSSRVLDDRGRVKDLDYLRVMQTWAMESAREAGLPLLPRPATAREALGELAGVAMDESFDALEDFAKTTILLPLRLAEIAGKVLAPDLVATADTFIEMRKRGVQALLFRASFGYGPLIQQAA